MHGLRTAASHRGQGLAGRLIRAMALYRRAGMTTAWTYAYWKTA